MNAIEARRRGTGHIQVVVRSEREMIRRDRRLDRGKHVDLALLADLEDRPAAIADVQVVFAIECEAGADSHALDIHG